MGRIPQPCPSDGILEYRCLQKVPMALVLLFSAVAQQCDVLLASETLDKAKRELLSMVLDVGTSRIDWTVHPQFLHV
jgi:hypothetical protein